jgi:hypothetical protein
VNLAPWNVNTHRLATFGPDGPVMVDGQPLIAYHFSSLRLNPDGTIRQLADAHYEIERSPLAVDLIYRPYLAAWATIDVGD